MQACPRALRRTAGARRLRGLHLRAAGRGGGRGAEDGLRPAARHRDPRALCRRHGAPPRPHGHGPGHHPRPRQCPARRAHGPRTLHRGGSGGGGGASGGRSARCGGAVAHLGQGLRCVPLPRARLQRRLARPSGRPRRRHGPGCGSGRGAPVGRDVVGVVSPCNDAAHRSPHPAGPVTALRGARPHRPAGVEVGADGSEGLLQGRRRPSSSRPRAAGAHGRLRLRGRRADGLGECRQLHRGLARW
mmetsp:Transcript_97583/g.281586  ORF Transcript_97583/g.281586 Transcript_97583/m.281586 type:complete len:245 (-) Transcript_97583:1251-1985(-)